MKKATVILIALAVVFGNVQFVNAQTTKQEKQETKSQQKQQDEVRKDVNKNAGKLAQKEAKKLEKEGWKTLGLPIAKQLEEMWMKQADKDASGYPKYLVADQMVTAQNISAAQRQGENLAKVSIAGQISTQVASLTDLAVANNELSMKDAASINKFVENSKNIVAQKLGRTVKVLEIYKPIKGDNVQVRMSLIYDMKAAMQIVKEATIQELKDDLEVNKAQLEKLMGL